MTDILLDDLRALLGPTGALSGLDASEKHRADWSGAAPVMPRAVVFPRSTAEVSGVMRLCHAADTPMVPQGGLTGLVGGAVPSPGAVVISCDRLVGVEEIDPVTATATVKAGTPLAVIQREAEAHDMILPLDLGSRESCAIGGNLATNAGGNRVIRYGMARDLVVALEAVTADGTVIGGLGKMLKNNTGYDLRHLLIGSEGTLALITRAVLKLHPKPATRLVAACGLADFGQVLAFLRAARGALGPALTSFEVMWPSFHDFMHERLPRLRRVLPDRHGMYVLLEASGFDPERDEERVAGILAGFLEQGLLADAALARSEREAAEFWAVRETVSEYGRLLGPITAFDLGFAIPVLQRAVEALERAIRAKWPTMIALFYGHIGDGNLHLVAHLPGAAEQPGKAIAALVYGITTELGGTVSAEHGIGTAKKSYLPSSRPAADLAAMRAIKRALDPKGLLNPGKVIDGSTIPAK